MKRWLTYLSLALLTVTLALFWIQPTRAEQPKQGATTPEAGSTCRDCHWDIYINWEGSAHGKGLSCGQCHLASQQDNHARLGHGAQGGPQQCMSCHTTGYNPLTDTWEEDNVHCTACHNPVPPEHPDKPAPINRSEELCGNCHIQARFEWEASKHGQAGVTCVNCHNQHRTSLKAENNDVIAQCSTCHQDPTVGFADSVHAKQGLSCGDCHLATLEGPLGEGSAKRNHGFEVELTTCVSCHSGQMHMSTAITETRPSTVLMAAEPLDSMASAINSRVCAEPEPPNLYGFMLIAGLVCLGVGIAIPTQYKQWFSRTFKRG